MNDKSNTYTGVETQKGLLGLRSSLAMYLGGTDKESDSHAPRALTQMMQESISNSRDEAIAGYGDEINVVIYEDNSMSVTDKGRGLPKGPGDSFEQVINSLTVPHSSGKFSSENYAYAGVTGMHGIGLKGINAGCRYVSVDAVCYSTERDSDGELSLTGGKERYRIVFNQEEVVESEFEPVSEDTPTGTTVKFLPDDGPISEAKPSPVLGSIEWVVADIEPALESSAFLMPGMTVTLRDEREQEPETRSWYYERGLIDYVAELVSGQQLINGFKDPIFIEGDTEVNGHDLSIKCALAFTEDTSGGIYSFANGVPTRHGGPHVSGFKSALLKSINDTANKLNDKFKAKLSETDVLTGVTAAIEVKLPGDVVKFEGQTKDQLATDVARTAANRVIHDGLMDWFSDNTNVAETVIDNAESSADSRAKLAKEMQERRAAKKSKTNKSKYVTSSKLKVATSKNPLEKELYVVEGDSASKIGRNTRTQAVFPLRGKILNVMKKKGGLTEALKNVEFSTIVKVLGAGVGPTFDIDELQYNKMILAADADVDGSHIRMLLFTLVYTYMPEMIDNGNLYILQPPLYRAELYKKGQREDLVVAYSDVEMRKLMPKLKGYDISRYKGLGQMESDEAHRYIADPEHRKLRQVYISDPAKTQKAVNAFMGTDAAPRAEWIDKHLNLNSREI